MNGFADIFWVAVLFNVKQKKKNNKKEMKDDKQNSIFSSSFSASTLS